MTSGYSAEKALFGVKRLIDPVATAAPDIKLDFKNCRLLCPLIIVSSPVPKYFHKGIFFTKINVVNMDKKFIDNPSKNG